MGNRLSFEALPPSTSRGLLAVAVAQAGFVWVSAANPLSLLIAAFICIVTILYVVRYLRWCEWGLIASAVGFPLLAVLAFLIGTGYELLGVAVVQTVGVVLLLSKSGTTARSAVDAV